MHVAAQSWDNTRILDVLVENGAKIDVKDKAKETPLHLAIQYWRSENVKHLISQGADIQRSNKNGQSPLALASSTKQEDLVALLQQEGARE